MSIKSRYPDTCYDFIWSLLHASIYNTSLPHIIISLAQVHSNISFIWLRQFLCVTIILSAFNKFPDFFVQVFKFVVDAWKFTLLLLYIFWDELPIFMISGSNEQQQQQLEYTLLNPDCHSRSISKMQSGSEDNLEERYAIKFCFKLEKMPQKRMECFRLLLKHLVWIEHEFLSGIRDSRSLWGMMRGVGGVRKSIDQSW